MNELRVFLSTILFTISSYLIYDLLVNGFSGTILFFCILGYISVHYIWPKQNDGESPWYELLEVIVDLPFRTMAHLLRSLGRLFRSTNDGIDIDL